MKFVGKSLVLLHRLAGYSWWKYLVTLAVGGFIVGFADERSIYNHWRNLEQIKEMQMEINRYNSECKRNQRKLYLLNNSAKEVERIARERYFMKQDDEDIFVLSDDKE